MNNNFEIGKYYLSKSTGELIAIRAQVDTTMWGTCFVAEVTSDMLGLVPINKFRDEEEWQEVSEDEWEKAFE